MARTRDRLPPGEGHHPGLGVQIGMRLGLSWGQCWGFRGWRVGCFSGFTMGRFQEGGDLVGSSTCCLYLG